MKKVLRLSLKIWFLRLPRHDEEFLVSLNGSPVAMYHQDIVIYIRKAVRADEKQNEFQSLDMKNIPKNINALKKGVSEAQGINFMAVGEDWRLRKIGNSFNFELFKIENVWNLKNEDKVEIVYEPRRDNIVKKAVMEDTKPKSSWDKFTGGNKLG